MDVYDRTQDPDTVPHTFIPSDEIPHYQQLEPGALGPSTKADGHGNPDPYIELAPNSGVWVPKSDFPGAKFYPPGGHGELPLTVGTSTYPAQASICGSRTFSPAPTIPGPTTCRQLPTHRAATKS